MVNFSHFFAAIWIVALAPLAPADGDATATDIMKDEWPRAFFFRSSEGMAANPAMSYEDWNATFSRLQGIMGKVLDEEVPGRSVRNIEFFTRFKQDNPNQIVLLHVNGNARDPRYQREKFFDGHWIYHNGAKILADVPAEEGETDIRVEDATLFRTGIGRFQRDSEDIGLCELDAEGKPDWHAAEQVQLVSVDAKNNVIRVKRGCYGSAPRAFKKGQAYAAAHVGEGPWGDKSHLLWSYNYSLRCPKDKDGRTAADVLVEELCRRFGLGGELAAFDGLEFDVLHNHCGKPGGGRGADCDADGKADAGVFGGVNEYGIGVTEFCRALRERFPENKILMADGHNAESAQRAFRILNGIESEGWPTLSDSAIRDWSGGINRHAFWDRNARPPVFNYINHKYTMPGDAPGKVGRPDVPFSTHRLVMAAACFTNAAVCYSYAPPKEPDEAMGIWDELKMGAENRRAWLGKPQGETRRLALETPDLLGGAGSPISPALLGRMESAVASLEAENGKLLAKAKTPGANAILFRLSDVPCDGPDLFISVAASAEPMAQYPPEQPRLFHVGIASGGNWLIKSELPAAGMRLRGGEETALNADAGATLSYSASAVLGGKARAAYRTHPPYVGGVGYTYWERDVYVPEGGALEFYTGMGEKAPERSDGVVFAIEAAELAADGKPGAFQRLYAENQVASEWRRNEVSLGAFGGKRARLRFVADCGPNDNATTDHAYWADARVFDPSEESEALTKPVRYQSWLGPNEFVSGFYFREVASKQVDLEFEIEGGEAVEISRISVHASADAIVREYENGIVLANPSLREYSFDLSKLAPGKTYRRLQASPAQDGAVNNGQPIGKSVVLQSKDALFLVKE